MIAKKSVLLTVVLVVSVALPAFAELREMGADSAQGYGKHLTEKFRETTKDPQVKFEVDPEQAVGLVDEADGILAVPIKGLKDGEPDPAAKSENGAGVCLVYMSQCYNPLIEGKPIDPKKLRRVKFTDGNGAEQEATCLIVTAKQVGDDDWRLCVFGAEEKPLIESKFGEASEGKKSKLTLQVKDVKDKQAKLVLTLFGKYSSGFSIAHK